MIWTHRMYYKHTTAMKWKFAWDFCGTVLSMQVEYKRVSNRDGKKIITSGWIKMFCSKVQTYNCVCAFSLSNPAQKCYKYIQNTKLAWWRWRWKKKYFATCIFSKTHQLLLIFEMCVNLWLVWRSHKIPYIFITFV